MALATVRGSNFSASQLVRMQGLRTVGVGYAKAILCLILVPIKSVSGPERVIASERVDTCGSVKMAGYIFQRCCLFNQGCCFCESRYLLVLGEHRERFQLPVR